MSARNVRSGKCKSARAPVQQRPSGMQQSVSILRVSTKKQLTEGEGIENQRRGNNAYIERKRYRLYREFVLAETADDKERADFEGVLNFLVENRKEVDVVVFWKMDRISRAGVGTYYALKAYLAKHGIRIEFAIAYTTAHEAGHTFGLRHTDNETVGNVNFLLTGSDIISKFSRAEQAKRLNVFSRFDLATAPSEQWNPSTENPYEVLKSSIGLALNRPAYVTGTGAHDHIRITDAGAGMANVTVTAFSDAELTTQIASYAYPDPISILNGILVETGNGDDRTEIDATLGVRVTVQGMAGNDQLVVVGDGEVRGSYTPGMRAEPNLDGNPSSTGNVIAGNTTITFQEFNPAGSLTVDNLASFTLIAPSVQDSVTVHTSARHSMVATHACCTSTDGC